MLGIRAYDGSPIREAIAGIGAKVVLAYLTPNLKTEPRGPSQKPALETKPPQGGVLGHGIAAIAGHGHGGLGPAGHGVPGAVLAPEPFQILAEPDEEFLEGHLPVLGGSEFAHHFHRGGCGGIFRDAEGLPGLRALFGIREDVREEGPVQSGPGGLSGQQAGGEAKAERDAHGLEMAPGRGRFPPPRTGRAQAAPRRGRW